MTIKQIQPDYRPDEKFLKFGGEALTGAELLAIILRTGSCDVSSVELAARLLYDDVSGGEDLLRILRYDIRDLLRFRGVGTVKALQIKSVAELSKRIASARTLPAASFTGPCEVAGHYMERLRHLKKESVVLVMLNSACAFIRDALISEGTVNASLFSPREIFLEALKYEAVNIILLHNHPSGSPEPSRADIESTKRLQDAGRIVGISLLDHIIIGDGRYVSLKEKGLIKD